MSGTPDSLRALPSVDRLAARLGDGPDATAAARAVIQQRRRALVEGRTDDADVDLLPLARERMRGTLRRVVNGTGVVVHTNLGRAPLADAARDAVTSVASGYASLELDLADGTRGSRQTHVEELLCELTGAEAALAVNNCAAAALLAVATLAGNGSEVIVSRGQLIEIGGSFRVPDVVAQSGATLVEVGTTNRTRASDYSTAISDATGCVLRAHPSNFRTVGFVEEVEIERLCKLPVPVVDDLGSGLLLEQLPALAGEPTVQRSVRAGAAIVCFSGDKLLGGPQAGLLVGRRAAIERAHAHPLARALRLDKLSIAALAATLALYRDPERAVRELPVLAMLCAGEDELAARAQRIVTAAGPRASLRRAVARVGGGALPLTELEGPVAALDPGAAGADALAEALRTGDPAVVGRIASGRVLLDPRTMTDEEAGWAGAAARRALG